MGTWYNFNISYDCLSARYTITVSNQGKEIFIKEFPFSQSVKTIERVLFTTKASLNTQDLEASGKFCTIGDLPDSDTPSPLSRLLIGSFSSHTEVRAGE